MTKEIFLSGMTADQLSEMIRESLRDELRQLHPEPSAKTPNYLTRRETARRLRIRFKDENGKTQLAHTLNNTCVAPPRMLIAFLENHLQADGTVTIPEVLRPYMGGKAVLVPNKK